MARREDFMGLGVPPTLARIYARHVNIATAFGTSVGSASKIEGTSYFTHCTTGTSSFVLPQISGDGGAYIGDEFFVFNVTSASIQVYIANTAQGSAVTIYGSAASTAGTTGITVPAGALARFLPLTVSTWAADSIVATGFIPTDNRQLEVINPVTVTVFGTTIGSANAVSASQYFTLCLTGTSALKLPQLGANTSTPPYVGDKFVIANMTAASILVFIANNSAGSAVTVYGGAASTAGTTGVLVPAGDVATFQIYGISTWVCGIASV